MSNYRCRWEIDVEADTPEGAALEAERIAKRKIDPNDELQARVWEVVPDGKPGDTVFVDLANLRED